MKPSTMSCFTHFHETWFDKLRLLLNQLSSAPRPPSSPEQHQHLVDLVHKVMSHYTEYYRVKALAAQRDALSVIAAPWDTCLERSLHWIAGWRPTTAFHIIYTESSIQFESHIADILRGLSTGDLRDLSPAQFRLISELQSETIREENAITEDISAWQDGASGQLLDDYCADVEEKIGRLVNVLEKAENLRLRTVQRVVDLLTTQQAVEFLIAMAELQFGIRAWGQNQERAPA